MTETKLPIKNITKKEYEKGSYQTLPTIKGMKVCLPVMKVELDEVLLAHEQHAEKMCGKSLKQFNKWKKKVYSGTFTWDYGIFMYNAGKQDALRSLRGGTK
jgi:hypothetical protein